MKLTVTKLKAKGPKGHSMIRVVGEGGANDVHDIESEDVDGYLVELRETAARAGHTVEVIDE